MSGQESSVCFACLKQFHQSSSSSSSVLTGSLLFTKFISFARQYLCVDASVSNLSKDQDDLDLCNVCSRRVDSICQLHNELQALEYRLSTKLEELAALMKQSKNENQKDVPCASRTNAVLNLRNEIVLKCFEKRELLATNRECQEKEETNEDDEAVRMEVDVDIKPVVNNLQEDSEDGTNLDDDDEEGMENSQNHSFGQLNKIENEEEDEQGEDSSSDHSFISSPGGKDSSGSESDCSDKGRSHSPQKDQARLTSDQPTSTLTENKHEGHEESVDKNVSKWWNPVRPCKHCGVVIEGPRRVHMRKHEKEREKQKKKNAPLEHLVCETCGASCVGRDALRRHMYYYHTGTTFICDVCGRTFRMKGDLRRHQLIHTGARDFKCHLCPAQYTENRRLKAHLVRTHGKEKGQEKTPGEGTLQRNCEYPSCSASFLSESELTSHIEQVHSKNEQGNVWICKLCGKVFSNRQRLIRHDLVHSQVKKHTCTVCSKAFAYPQSLKEHVKAIHLKERFPCTQPGCDQTFWSSRKLCQHLRRKHEIYSAKYRSELE